MKTLLLSILFVGAATVSAEVRTFTDVKGRKLEAELVKARGPNVVLRMDRKEVPVPLKNFSREDQTAILQWIATDPMAIDYRFDCRETEKDVPRPDADPGEEAPHRGYEVTVANRCLNTVDGIRLCYRVFLDDRVDAIRSWFGERKLMFKSGDEVLPALSYGKSAKVTTRGHVIDKTRSNGFSGQPERDRLRGVWLRFYKHGVMVAEWKSGTVPKCEWPASKSEEERLAGDKDQQAALIASMAAKPAAPAVEPAKPAAEPVKPAAPEVAENKTKPAAPDKPAAKEDDVPEEIKIFEMTDEK